MKQEPLSTTDIHDFMEKGFVKIDNALSKDFVRQWWGPRQAFFEATSVYKDRSHVHCPVIRKFDPDTVCPTVVSAIESILGGGDRIKHPLSWGDGFAIAQPLSEDNKNSEIDKLYDWHVDGFHRHFLNSPEIGLVLLIAWTDATEQNGATSFSMGSHKIVARELAKRSDGMSNKEIEALDFSSCKEYRAVAQAGDVYLMHPFMLHSRTRNHTPERRAITNPHIALVEPLCLYREDKNYSVLETSILKATNQESIVLSTPQQRKDEETQIEGNLDLPPVN